MDPSNLTFQIQRDPAPLGTPLGGPRFNPPPAADGSFAWTISPGDYRVSVLPLENRQRDDRTRAGGGPPVSDALQNAYVKSIRWGRSDVLADGLHTWGARGTSKWSSAPPPRSAAPLATWRVSPLRRHGGRHSSGSNRGRSDLRDTRRQMRRASHAQALRPRLFVLRLGRSGARRGKAWSSCARSRSHRPGGCAKAGTTRWI